MSHRPDQPDPYATSPAEAGAVLVGIGAVITGAWAIAEQWDPWLTAWIVFVCAPAAGVGIFAALGRAGRGRRLRIRYQGWPFPAILLTDTPRPTCPDCRGRGGWTEDWGDAYEEYGGTEDVLCDCWTDWHHTLLALPRPLAELHNRRTERRRNAEGCSEEPPF